MAWISARSEADVVEAVRSARDAKSTLEIVGRGSKRGYGRPVECDDRLDLSGLSGILKYEPDELVITALAGTPVAEIEAALAEKSQRLGFEPADWGPLFGSPANSATIGGALSADTSGSAAIRYGRARDHLLGFRAVNGLAEAYKAGGRVVKNVTGFDLPKLMCGAMGTLGPLTEVTLRVFPKPARTAVCEFTGLNGDESVRLLRSVWSSQVEATGLCYRFEDDVGFIRLEGTKGVLEEKIALLRGMHNAEHITKFDGHLPLIDECFPKQDDIWRVFVPPGDVMEIFSDNELWGDWLADWAGGLIWIASDGNLHEIAARLGGAAMLFRASEDKKRRFATFPPQPQIRAELTNRVKAAFDPLGLFNPGRMWEGV